MAKTSIQCEVCKNSFLRETRDINRIRKRGQKHYCSRKCQAQGRRMGRTHNCKQCNKEFYAKRCETNNGMGIFCSRSCNITYQNLQRIGPAHPSYKNGKTSYRRLAFIHYKACCRVCGYDKEPVLQVHHIDKDRSNNELDNLVILCPTHHVEAHLGLINIRFIHKFLSPANA